MSETSADMLRITASGTDATEAAESSTNSHLPPLVPPSSDPSTSHFLLPLPTPPSNNSQSSFVARDIGGEDTLLGFDVDLPPDVATADISIAPDGSFLETSSGAAARELKRRYDQYLGVGKDVRSPYAITAFVNQHGKQMYRVGHRELSAPGASAEDAEHRASKSYISTRGPPQLESNPAQMRRRSRMSVHSFLPPSVFRHGSPSSGTVPLTNDGSRSPPVRRLRKTRSIPNLLDSSTAESGPQGQPTGRPHAHSVSSADAFRVSVSVADEPVQPFQRDIFADVMSWHSVPPSPLPSNSASLSTRSLHSPTQSPSKSTHFDEASNLISHPFGTGVSFDAPSWRSAPHSSSPPMLREMQSFESVLTARADYQTKPSRGSNLQPPLSEGEHSTSDNSRSPIVPHLMPPPLAEPLDETIMHSRYSTDVFDILQTSRGLPSLDKITPTSNEKTVKLSLKADDSAAPRDDPRFVIWGEVESQDPDNGFPCGVTDLSSGLSGTSRRKSGKDKSVSPSTDSLFISVPPENGPTKMLVAATIERWIAQLTSELNYDELLIFFLTYRTYVSAVDLGHLLICRFHWALGEPTSSRDETIRRIVRVRTFTAIRYWLLTFFNVDFAPNRELRVLFADWLNSLRRDPVLQRHKDALKIVRQLRKVVLDCKDAYLRKGKGTTARQSSERSDPPGLRAAQIGDLSGGRFTESNKKPGDTELDESDIDLDFDGGEPSQSFGADAVSVVGSSPQPVELAMLRQPLNLTFLQYGKQNAASFPRHPVPHPVLLPVPHNTLSRVFVNTIGRLGRWKRVLNARSPGRTALNACVDVSAFDVEANETGDLLLVRGGVEQYLRMVERQMSQASLVARTNSIELAHEAAHPGGASTIGFSYDLHLNTGMRTGEVDTPKASYSETDSLQSSSLTDTSDTLAQRDSVTFSSTDSADSLKTPVTSSYVPSIPSGPQLDIVSIDDLDLSDLSSDEDLQPSVPPGLKKLPRRLPTRRDFEFVRQSLDSVSSMGIRTRGSLMSGGSTSSVGPDIGGPIQQWHVNALVDSLSDEEETGDVEAALRRLEGQISRDKQQAKQSKVDRWVQSIQERQAAGHFGADPVYDSSDEEDYGAVDYSPQRNHTGEPSLASTSQTSLRSSANSVVASAAANWDSTAPSANPGGLLPSSASETVTPITEKKSDKDEAVPPDNTQSTGVFVTPPFLDHHATILPIPVVKATPTSTFVQPNSFTWHRSFVMGFRTETLVEHFSMIDRELFLNIRFEELVSSRSLEMNEDASILDWGQFLRERARMKAEGRGGYKTGSLTVVRGRFNLMANFVLSEIVLTHPSERTSIFGKFLRMALKAYSLRNFNTLVAIMAGLTSHWVTRAMRQCPSRVSISEVRILKDLAGWTTKEGDFKYIRHTVDTLAEGKGISVNPQDASNIGTDGQSSTTRSRAASEGKPPSLPSCVPFIGVYLSQLHRYSSLPDLIDPTAPDEPVGIDPITNTFETPSHPEVFAALAPLPPTIQLEPLINVHKQRLIAGVVKSLVAGQHLASRVQFPLDKRLFQRCLKLRGLDTDTLERALSLSSDAK
ncbi:ras GEF [Amylocystis lapponica]|nr:ras GEF [Amylocystis lapponica]